METKVVRSGMGATSNYWRLVRVDSGGRRTVEEKGRVKTWLFQNFPSLVNQIQVADQTLQETLFSIRQRTQSLSGDRTYADLSLRCTISHFIEYACIQLAKRFGELHSFTCDDLLGLVLDDDGRTPLEDTACQRRQSLSQKILEGFDPAQARLSTWVTRQVRHHPEVKTFLLEQGVFLVTDWAILKDTRVEQARQILTEFHMVVASEVERACHLLQAYHTVYRSDRLQQRQHGKITGRAECVPPTPTQMDRMITILQSKTYRYGTTEDVMEDLRALAKSLRQYRLYVRNGTLPTTSLDQPNAYELATSVQVPCPDDDQDERDDFLTFYRTQLQSCLDQAVEQVMGDRIAYLQRKKPQMVNPFLTAMHLFHCCGLSMGEIAPLIGLKAQFQVTRLMKLKEFRASVQARVITILFDQVWNQAQGHLDPDQLSALSQQVETLINEDVAALMQQSEAEATAIKHRPLTSVFAQRLCCYLKTRSIAS